MSLISSVIRAAERTPLPDPLARAGIAFLVGARDGSWPPPPAGRKKSSRGQ